MAQIHATAPPAAAGLKSADFLGELARYEDIYRASGVSGRCLELAFQHPEEACAGARAP